MHVSPQFILTPFEWYVGCNYLHKPTVYDCDCYMFANIGLY